MELIGRISKGSKMDQIYLPKNREGFDIGEYVLVEPLNARKKFIEKPYFYNVESIEKIKLNIIREIMNMIDARVDNENIIITGSFLDKGFCFNDIDVIVVSEKKFEMNLIRKNIEEKLGIKVHFILLNNKTLRQGLSTDPLYRLMLNRCISKKRFVYNLDSKLNYKILDLHLLKSKVLIDNFEMLNGIEKYHLVRNLIAISLFLGNKKITTENVCVEIKKQFNVNKNEIEKNMLEKISFLKKYKILYNKTFNQIMRGIKSEPKQK